MKYVVLGAQSYKQLRCCVCCRSSRLSREWPQRGSRELFSPKSSARATGVSLARLEIKCAQCCSAAARSRSALPGARRRKRRLADREELHRRDAPRRAFPARPAGNGMRGTARSRRPARLRRDSGRCDAGCGGGVGVGGAQRGGGRECRALAPLLPAPYLRTESLPASTGSPLCSS